MRPRVLLQTQQRDLTVPTRDSRYFKKTKNKNNLNTWLHFHQLWLHHSPGASEHHLSLTVSFGQRHLSGISEIYMIFKVHPVPSTACELNTSPNLASTRCWQSNENCGRWEPKIWHEEAHCKQTQLHAPYPSRITAIVFAFNVLCGETAPRKPPPTAGLVPAHSNTGSTFLGRVFRIKPLHSRSNTDTVKRHAN